MRSSRLRGLIGMLFVSSSVACAATPDPNEILVATSRVTLTRANGLPALVFYARRAEDDAYRLHSIQVVRFEGGAVAEATTFIGPTYLRGFDVAPTVGR